MSIMQQVTQASLTRQEQLRVWLRRMNLTQAKIAELLGVEAVSISRWFYGRESIPTWRHGQLTSLGIPAELLPPAVDKAPGPKRGKRCSESFMNTLPVPTEGSQSAS